MKPKALLIVHEAGQQDDRASAFLASRGFDLVWACPAEGGGIPEIGEDISALIVYGGKYGVPDKEIYPFLRSEMRALRQSIVRDIPVLGLCLGAQLLAHELGADVGPHPAGWHEYGYYRLEPTVEGRDLFPEGLMALQSHWHQFGMPADATRLASSELFPNQALRYGERAFGFQFHPEASRTMLSAWIERRGERNYAAGAHSPTRQLSDNSNYDRALADWFVAFLDVWSRPALLQTRAA